MLFNNLEYKITGSETRKILSETQIFKTNRNFSGVMNSAM